MKLAMAVSAATQVFNALTGIIVIPVYPALMGEAAFGLIGVFVMVQAAQRLLRISGTCWPYIRRLT